MNRAVRVAAVALAVLVAAAVWVARNKPAPQAQASRVPDPPAGARAESRVESPSTVLAIDPRRASRPPAAAGPRPHGVVEEFLAATRYQPLWERLRHSPEGSTAEGAYVLYRIARRCARMSDAPGAAEPDRDKTLAQKRDDFLRTLAPDDPQRDQRLAAFDKVNAPRCEGIELTLAKTELQALLLKAVDAGSPEARAVRIGQDVEQTQRGRADSGTLTDAQIEGLRQLAATRDPGTLLEIGRILSSSYRDLTLRDGPDGRLLEPLALHSAWTLLACEYGYPCDEGNATLQGACAFQGHCDASNLQDYLYYYASSPHDSQLMNQYEAMLRHAVETGDWSRLALVRGPRPPNLPMYYWGSTR